MKFIADCMLGKLAKWLRMIGYDTVYIRGAGDDDLVRLALQEDRVLLTRDNLLCKRRILRGRCVLIEHETTREQIRQLQQEVSLNLPQEHTRTRCAVCNGEIWQVSRESLEGEVPPYVYKTQSDFGRCTSCGKVYWKGSHTQRIIDTLNEC